MSPALRILIAGLALAAGTAAGAQTLNPTADAYVLGGTWAGSNFGTSTGLFAQTSNNANSSYDSYLKFDTTSVGGAGSVASATFRVSASVSGAGVATTLYAVADTTWSETAITWNNKPARGAALASATVSGGTAVYYEFDVTAYVQSEKAAGRNVVAFALHNPSNSSQAIWMSSRESTAKPQLVIVPNAAPTVSLTAPANNSVFLPPANVTVTASASDADGTIAKVEFFDGATLAATVTAPPYTATLASLAAGAHSFTARATDNLGLATTSAAMTIRVDAAPAVSIASPASGQLYNAPASFPLTANASDTDGAIAKVDFYRGATLVGTAIAAPYTAAVTDLAAGSYSFTAVATDGDGAQTTSAAVNVIVNALPTVALTSPANSATFNAPASIVLTAQVADTDGAIASVSFYYGSTLITTLNAAPYTFTWTGVPAGAYSLTAQATDNAGATASSAAVGITVNNAVAQLHFIHVDHLNTPRAIYDAQQQLRWKWEQQEPFGNNVPDQNPSGVSAFDFPLRLPGQRYDAETALHYNYFRDYDPNLGSYKQSDLIGLRGGLNTYAYVAGDPLTHIDPNGLAGQGKGRKLPNPAEEMRTKNEKAEGAPDAVKGVACALGLGYCPWSDPDLYICTLKYCTPKCGIPYYVDYLVPGVHLEDPDTPCQCLRVGLNPNYKRGWLPGLEP